MPYEIRRRSSRYEVVNTDTDESHGLTTKRKAEKQLRLLRGIEHGWKPSGKNTYTKRFSNGTQVKLRVKSKRRASSGSK